MPAPPVAAAVLVLGPPVPELVPPSEPVAAAAAVVVHSQPATDSVVATVAANDDVDADVDAAHAHVRPGRDHDVWAVLPLVAAHIAAAAAAVVAALAAVPAWQQLLAATVAVVQWVAAVAPPVLLPVRVAFAFPVRMPHARGQRQELPRRCPLRRYCVHVLDAQRHWQPKSYHRHLAVPIDAGTDRWDDNWCDSMHPRGSCVPVEGR